jgi:hypothetical protein
MKKQQCKEKKIIPKRERELGLFIRAHMHTHAHTQVNCWKKYWYMENLFKNNKTTPSVKERTSYKFCI